MVLSGAQDLSALETEILRLGPGAATYLLNLTLEGGVPLSATPEIELRLSRLRALLFDLYVDRRKLMVAATDADLSEIADAGLAAVAGRLKNRAETGDAGEQRAVARALEKLVALAAGNATGRLQ